MNTPSVSLRQVAIVVRDLDAAVAAYHRILGWGPCQILDFSRLPHRDTRVRRVPAAYDMRRQFAGVDHGFTHNLPLDTAETALRLMADHLNRAFAKERS